MSATSLLSGQQGKAKADSANIPPTFMLGGAGSGATLLRRMLNAHPSVLIPSEDASQDHQQFPNSKFILVLRDPRDAVATCKVDLGWDFTRSRDEWEKSVLHGVLAKLHLGPSRVKEVKYEALVTEPCSVLRDIYNFLQVPYTDVLLTYCGSDAAKTSLPEPDRREDPLDREHSGSIGRYRQILTQEEVDGICSRLDGPMRLLGYLSDVEYEQVSRNGLIKFCSRARQRPRSPALSQPAAPRTTAPRETLWRSWFDVPPVFIVGHGRSGTTLLRMMLSAHPRIFISSEGAYVCALRARISAHGDLRDKTNLERLRNDLLPWLESVNYLNPPDLEELAAWVERVGCDERALITFYGTWEARMLGKHDLEWWGDNEPSHVFGIPYFKKTFPRAKFILMIRDPRDIYASFHTSWPGVHTAESLAMLWERCLLDGVLAASCLGDSTVKQVKYENLVANPRAQLEEICDFLHVDYTDAMLKFPESEPARQLSSSVVHHRNVGKPVFTSSVGRFRQILTREDIAAIEDRLATPMRYFGYI